MRYNVNHTYVDAAVDMTDHLVAAYVALGIVQLSTSTSFLTSGGPSIRPIRAGRRLRVPNHLPCLFNLRSSIIIMDASVSLAVSFLTPLLPIARMVTPRIPASFSRHVMAGSLP